MDHREHHGGSELAPDAGFRTSQFVCITCSDGASPARVLELLPGGNAMAELDGSIQEIDVELCDASVGDVVLVHARIAIAKLNGIS